MAESKADLNNFYSEPDPNIAKPGSAEAGDYPFRADEGRGLIDLPTRNKNSRIESVAIRDIPAHAIRQIERSFERGDDPAGNTFEPGNPAATLGHFAGLLQGSGLVDEQTAARLDKLVDQFARTPEAGRKQFFTDKIRPFFVTLKTAARPKESGSGS